jgi:hypothetical protein
MDGYCDHVAKVSGRQILAEKLGLLSGSNNVTIAVPVAQNHPSSEIDIPAEDPTAKSAAEAAEAAADAVADEIGAADVVSATEAIEKMELNDGPCHTLIH